MDKYPDIHKCQSRVEIRVSNVHVKVNPKLYMQLFPSVLFHYTKLLMYIYTVGQTQLHQRARKSHLDAKIVLMFLNKTAKVRLYGHGITFYLRCKGLSLTVRRKQVLLEWLQLRRPNVFTRQVLKTILLSGGSGFALLSADGRKRVYSCQNGSYADD